MTKFSLENARKRSKKANAKITSKVMSNPEVKAMYERKRREIEIALLMRETREKAQLSQNDVAERMHTTRSAIARLESLGTGRHSPSIETLLKYAQALGYTVNIKLIANKNKDRHEIT